MAHVVGRQQGGDIGLQIQQIPDRSYVVFGPVQAVENGLAGFGVQGVGAVDTGFERSGEGFDRSGIRTRQT